MSNTPTVAPVTITYELSKIIKAIGKQRPWERIFNEYCARTGEPTVTVKQQFGMSGFSVAEATWQGRRYHSRSYSFMSEANEDLFLQLVSMVIRTETSKVN